MVKTIAAAVIARAHRTAARSLALVSLVSNQWGSLGVIASNMPAGCNQWMKTKVSCGASNLAPRIRAMAY